MSMCVLQSCVIAVISEFCFLSLVIIRNLESRGTIVENSHKPSKIERILHLPSYRMKSMKRAELVS